MALFDIKEISGHLLKPINAFLRKLDFKVKLIFKQFSNLLMFIFLEDNGFTVITNHGIINKSKWT